MLVWWQFTSTVKYMLARQHQCWPTEGCHAEWQLWVLELKLGMRAQLWSRCPEHWQKLQPWPMVEKCSRVQIRSPARSEKERKRKVCCSTRIHSVEYHALSGDSLSISSMFYVWSVSSMYIFGGVLCQSVRLGILRELVLTLRHFYTLYWDLMANMWTFYPFCGVSHPILSLIGQCVRNPLYWCFMFDMWDKVLLFWYLSTWHWRITDSHEGRRVKRNVLKDPP